MNRTMIPVRRKTTMAGIALALFIAIPACAHDQTCRDIQCDPYWDETTKYLAGLPLPRDSKYYARTQTPAYQKHTEAMDRFWGQVSKETLGLVMPWRERNVPSFRGDLAFYPLSGADFINLYLMYPDAPRYLMVAMEPPGTVPELLLLPDNQLNLGLTAIQRVIRRYGELNYFQSLIMKNEMSNFVLPGTAPVILVFMSRMGLTIQKVEKVGIDKSGFLQPADQNYLVAGERAACRGMRIYFTAGRGGRVRELVYLSLRLSDEVVSPKTPTGRFFESLGEMATLMKSAVYLLHMNAFKGVNEFIVRRSVMFIQDDSGAPYESFPEASWDIRLFGIYKPFHVPGCTYKIQPKMTEAFQSKKVGPLPFNYGYGVLKGKNHSNLMIAKRRSL